MQSSRGRPRIHARRTLPRWTRARRAARWPGPVCLALVACGPQERRPPAEPDAPSIILISIDTLRADHMGLYGYERDTTPQLDAFAREALVFDRAHTTYTWTPVAHMSLLTGLYPTQHRVLDIDSALAESVATLAERLRGAGYHTAGLYGNELLDPCFGFGRGFDVYEPHLGVDAAQEHLTRVLAKRPADRPIFLFVHLYDVHNTPRRSSGWTIYEPPPPFDRMFVEDARERVLEVDTLALWFDHTPELTERLHEGLVALYDGGVRFVDGRVGTWLDEWRASGLLDEAVVVVTSDHGEGLAQHYGDRYGGHGELFQEGLRVPLLVRLPEGVGPGPAAGRRADPVSLVDLVPTLLGLAGLASDPRLPGRSLLEPGPDERLLFAEGETLSAYIRWPWKVIESRGERDGRAFDLATDPREEHCLRTEQGLERFLERAGPIRREAELEREQWYRPDAPGRAERDPEMDDRLRALGYLDGE